VLFAIIPSIRNRLTWSGLKTNNRDEMATFFLFLFRFFRLLMSGHQTVALENAALRLQPAAFQRKRKRPVLTTLDFGSLFAAAGPVGAVRFSMSRRTPSPIGSASHSAGFGPDCATRMADDEAGQLRPCRFAN